MVQERETAMGLLGTDTRFVAVEDGTTMKEEGGEKQRGELLKEATRNPQTSHRSTSFLIRSTYGMYPVAERSSRLEISSRYKQLSLH